MAAITTVQTAERQVEQKFIFPLLQKGMILDWLEHVGVPNSDYSYGPVSSIYYDTPGLELYGEKRNGDYLKRKVRLRWYADLQAVDSYSDVQCFWEIKQKLGARRHKQRSALCIKAHRLTQDPFSDELISGLPASFGDSGFRFPQGIFPALMIRFDRLRFVDPRSGARLAVDTNISCQMVNTHFFAGLVPVDLGMGVLELKAQTLDIPESLEMIGGWLTRTSFSKYAQCVERVMQPIGRRI